MDTTNEIRQLVAQHAARAQALLSGNTPDDIDPNIGVTYDDLADCLDALADAAGALIEDPESTRRYRVAGAITIDLDAVDRDQAEQTVTTWLAQLGEEGEIVEANAIAYPIPAPYVGIGAVLAEKTT